MADGREVVRSFIKFAYADLGDESNRKWLTDFGVTLGVISPGDLPQYRAFVSQQGRRLQPYDLKVLGHLQKETLRSLEWIVDRLNDDLHLEFDIEHSFMWGSSFAYGSFLGRKIIKATILKGSGAMMGRRVGEIEFPAYFREFFRGIDGFPKSALKRCVRCRTIFFNPTKRPKNYCSQQCQHAEAVKRIRTRQKQEE
jgi:hypothetical protein